jgi:uncharacterized spore protein YtfJ
MEITQVLEEAREAIGTHGVFGTPYEKDGVTVIPAARVMGGGGAGKGETPANAEGGTETTAQPSGSGGGFGLSARPMGAFVVKGEDVRWLPAIDVNRLMVGFQVALVVFFLAMRAIAKSRAPSAKPA